MKLAQKRNEFAQQIRRQSINRKLGLKRIQPILVQSTQQALKVLQDGTAILQSSQDQYQLCSALKSLCMTLSKYNFTSRDILLQQLKRQLVWLISSPNTSHLFLELGSQCLKHICYSNFQIIDFKDLNLKLLDSSNPIIIRNTLCSLTYLINQLDQRKIQFAYLFKQLRIFRYFNQLFLNFNQFPDFLIQIKYLFVFCAVSLGYIYWKIGPNHHQTDFISIIQLCVKIIEEDILFEAEKDVSLKVFLQKQRFLQNHDNSQILVINSFPFPLYRLLSQTIEQINSDVILAMMNCLQWQIQNNQVYSQPVCCLCKLFSTKTQIQLTHQLKKSISRYILSLCYIEEQPTYLLQLLTIMDNNTINNQQVDYTFFNSMSDQYNQMFPKCAKLVHLVDYLDKKQLNHVKDSLFKFISNLIVLNGDSGPLIQYEAYFGTKNYYKNQDQQNSEDQYTTLQYLDGYD